MVDTVHTSSGGLQDVTVSGAPIPDADTQAVATSGGSLQEVPPAMGGGDDAVTSVNGKSGPQVTLTAADVGALPDSYTPPAPDWDDVANKPTAFTATSASVIAAMAGKAEIEALATPTDDYADMTEATAAIKSIIDALQAP